MEARHEAVRLIAWQGPSQAKSSCASERIRYVTNYVCLKVAWHANKSVHLAHFLSTTDASTLGSKQYNR